MENYSEKYWEKLWKSEPAEELIKYLEGYHKFSYNIMEIFKQNGIKKICDAACGFGGYTLAYISNGFEVESFDVSKAAVDITKLGLEKYGFDASKVKVADMLETGYQDSYFDGVLVNSVIDHLTAEDAKKALAEMLRITREGGLVSISFDGLEEEDLTAEHEVLEDGSFYYTGEDSRKGMIFHQYDVAEIKAFLQGKTILFQGVNGRNQQVVVLRK